MFMMRTAPSLVAARQHLTGIEAAGRERNVQNARLYAAARAERDIAHAKLEALVDDAARFLPDDLHFLVQMRVGKRLLGHHADDLPCAAQPLRVRLHRRDADGLVRAFDDDLRGLGKRRDPARRSR